MTFDKGLFKPLTAKETSILQSLSDGPGTKEIAAMHGTSEQTIKNFVYRSCQKIGCDNRVHLVAQATVRNRSLKDFGSIRGHGERSGRRLASSTGANA